METTHYDRLTKQLTKTPYIVAGTDDTVTLTTESVAKRLAREAGAFGSDKLILNLAGALEGFAREVGKADRTFTLSEIATMARIGYPLAYNYCQREIFVPSVRPFTGAGRPEQFEALFSWTDGFISGLVGAMRRNRMSLDALKKVRPLLSEQKQKQTGQRVQAVSRS